MEDAIELPTESSRSHLNEVVKSILATDNFALKTLMGSSIGDNYIGVVYRVVATTNGSNDAKKADLSVIVKLPPQNTARREQFFAGPSFMKEIWVYDELLPLFQQFQEQRGIQPTNEGFYEVPKCYRTVSIAMEEALFFEDLKVSGFEMFDRLKEISIEHAQLVMQVLGKFHALSFAIRDQDPERFESLKSIKDWFADSKEHKTMIDYVESLKERAMATLNEDTEAEVLEKFTAMFQGTSAMNVMTQLSDGNLSEPNAVVCHGDCWNNNILFKYDSAGKPVETRFLDWQIARYASPACDLSHYIFLCTSKSLRAQHYESLLKTYHKSFSTLLNRLGSNAEKLFSYDALLNEMKKNGRFGIIMGMMLLPLITSDANDIPDLDKMSEQMNQGETIDANVFKFEKSDQVYKTKMRDIILDMDRLGYI